jgi:ABC-type multidrug transport system ATPase subunit/ABC-type multidrug transport system permease subunit
MSEKILQWKNLTIEKSSDKSMILNSLDGEAVSGEALAIMGSSGAGKTTLLNYLSGKSIPSGVVKKQGEINFCIDNVNYTKFFGSLSGYVTQDDILLEVLTPKELLTFAAEIRLNIDASQRKELVDNLIANLGIEKCKDTRVGNVMSKGLSGGERKRTAIGYELITDPYVLFLDEPTTGLDSISAYKIIKLITEEARKGKIIIFTIHQPRSDIFKLFDKLLLLAQGKTVYFDKASKAIEYFNSLNFKCPPHYNPAEYFIKILSKENLLAENQTNNTDPDADDKEYFDKIKLLSEHLKEKYSLTEVENIYQNKFNLKIQKKHGFLKELIILIKRNRLLMMRDKLAFFLRFIMIFFNSVLIILIFFRLGKGSNAVIDRNGCLFYITNSVVNTNMQTNLLLFTKEKQVFYKEQDNKMYRVITYYLSKTLAELPFQLFSAFLIFFMCYFLTGLNSNSFMNYVYFIITVFLTGYAGSSFAIFMSCIIDKAEIAPAIFPILIFTQTLTSGYFVSQKDIPNFLLPFYYISIFRYSYQSLAINEYTDNDVGCGNSDDPKCRLPTEDFSDSLAYSIYCLLIITIINNFISCIALKIKAISRLNK